MTIDELKAQIDSTIKSNGQRLITGAQLNSILNAIATYTAEVEGVSLKVPQFLPFDSIIANAEVQVGSTSATDYEIVYVESKNVFTAYTGGVYYTDWVGSLSYNKGTFSKTAIATNLYINPYAEIYKIENSKLVAIQKYDIANVIATYGDGLATLSYKGSTIYPETKGSQVKLSIGKNAEDAIKQNGSNIVKEKERAQQVEMYLESQKADKTGYYENLSVGVSDNLSGRGEATESEFAMRPSGGENKSIQDGTARINAIKGNSVVYNQLATQPEDNIVKVGESKFLKFNRAFLPKNNHVYLCTVCQKETLTSCERNTFQVMYHSESGVKNIFENPITNYKLNKGLRGWFFTLNDAADKEAVVGLWVHSPDKDVAYEDFKLHDLTKMFNGVNVPTTVEEFEALYGNMPDEYNAGEIIDNHTSAIKSVGVNAWDEEWDNGLVEGSGSNNTVRSKNFIPVIPNAKYFYGSQNNTGFVFALYDKDKQFVELLNTPGRPITIPSNVHYIKFRLSSDYGTVYNHDICIHLVHTGYLNGKYFPYESQIRQLPTVEGGLKSAGTAYDEIRYNKSKDKWEHVKRVGSVDLGTLSWRIKDTGNTNVIFMTTDRDQWPKNMKYTNTYNALSNKYFINSKGATGSVFNNLEDKTIGFYYENGLSGRAIYIRDTLYTDLTTFTESLQGVILYYELAEPIVTELDVDISPDYKVWDYGTEEAISEVLSTPVRVNTNYGFNAVGQITDNTELIKELLARVAVLEAQVAQANSANVEPIEPIVE